MTIESEGRELTVATVPCDGATLDRQPSTLNSLAIRLLQRLFIAVARAYVKLWHRCEAWGPDGRRLSSPISLNVECGVRSSGFRIPKSALRIPGDATGHSPGAILVANHTSPVDPLVLQANVKQPIGFLFAREFFEVRPFTWFYRVMGCIAVERGRRDLAATKAALRHLARGNVLGIFPEGGLNPDRSRLLAFRPGAALLALRARVPVVPVHVRGTPRGRTLSGSFFHRARIEVRFGSPMDLGSYRERLRDPKTLEAATRHLERAVARLGRVCPSSTEAAESRSPAGLG